MRGHIGLAVLMVAGFGFVQSSQAAPEPTAQWAEGKPAPSPNDLHGTMLSQIDNPVLDPITGQESFLHMVSAGGRYRQTQLMDLESQLHRAKFVVIGPETSHAAAWCHNCGWINGRSGLAPNVPLMTHAEAPAVASLTVADPAPVARAAAAGHQCHEVDIPVTVVVWARVHGTYCTPTGAPTDTIQILVHGATYDRHYWDQAHDYPAAANAAGYATLAIDKPGYGDSTHLPSATLTATSQASAIHQVIGALRTGAIGGRQWHKIVAVGHSMGAGQVLMEAATYHDVDAVVLTGMTHHVSPDTLLHIVLAQVHPAPLDPVTRVEWPLDAGMLTTIPGQRAPLFHADATPETIANDEATKSVVSSVEIAETLTQAFTLPISRAINVPVLLVNGSKDAIFCAGTLGIHCSTPENLADAENPYFAPAARLTTEVIVGAGHSLELSPQAPTVSTIINSWLATQ